MEPFLNFHPAGHQQAGAARASVRVSSPPMKKRDARASFSPGYLIDQVVGLFAPRAGLRRMQYRSALAHYYEGVEQTRLRKVPLINPSGDGTTYGNTLNLRAVARDLERNLDLARSVISVLVRHVVGTGIGIEPQPRTKNGEIASEVAKQIRQLLRQWGHRPEVTREMSWGMTQRLAARRWVVDGEVLAHHVEGRVPTLKHSTAVPYSVELLEADQLSDWITDPSRLIMQGVQRDEWGKALTYYIYRGNPGDLFIAPRSLEATPVDARRITHLKFTDRIRQARGVSMFASVMNRFRDIKDYEDSERIAAKVAASLAAVIIKGDPTSYGDSTALKDSETEARELTMRAGIIFDDLHPGEDVRTIDTKRPNAQLAEFRNGQLRAVAGGTESGYSSISKNYNGTYSAQRQELVEQYGAYGILAEHFVAQFVEPIYRRFIGMAIASGQLVLPAGIDMATVVDALFLAPQMPWIDPLKEANAYTVLEEAGHASGPEIIRRRGQNPDDVLEQEAEWQKRRTERGLTYPETKETIRARLMSRPAWARGQSQLDQEGAHDDR